MSATTEFENEWVRVLRVRHDGQERHPSRARHDRLIIYLTDGHIARTEGERREEIRRTAGTVVWRPRSEHEIENLKTEPHEVLIVELKQARTTE